SGVVMFNGIGAGAAISWSASLITVKVPIGATSGTVAVTAAGVASNSLPLYVIPAPTITSIYPASGPVGTQVTITGSGFGWNQTICTVTFNGTAAGTASSWADTSITVNVPSGATTGNVVVAMYGAPSNPVVFTVIPVPSLASVSPTSGVAGTPVTISGSNFGTVQGSGTLLLGSTTGTVVTWSDTQILATVASNARSGSARVQQNGYWSNSVPFTVSTATISSVSPTTGTPGVTQVTVTGSGFGSAQGSGQVWLGTANGVVQSWSDTQIVATVAAGSFSGNAQVLQNGVMSNAIPFTVDALQIASVSPTSGAAGTSVTFTGSGFGASPGVAWLGSTAASSIQSWTDTQVVATVAPAALTGVAKIQQNGVWSNAVGFTVPAGSGNALVPALLNMVVGDTRTLQALNASGQTVTGLTWATTDPTIVSLSTDDPPLLTALAVGNVTTTAGTAAADVTVSAATLPLGTVIWSNPGDGSGVTSIVPAVPSTTGVADVFAFQADGTVQAITADGTTAWSADVSQAEDVLPDFQGGLVVSTGNSIYKLDGITGQAYPAYTPPAPDYTECELVTGGLAVHPDGTIFTSYTDKNGYNVIGIDPTTGTQKFMVPATVNGVEPFQGGSTTIIVAGDGYAYYSYPYLDSLYEYPATCRLGVLRVSSSGNAESIAVFGSTCGGWAGGLGYTDLGGANMITNADQGILLTWQTPKPDGSGFTSQMATITGGAAAMAMEPWVPSEAGTAVVPVLQAQDGSFVGTFADENVYQNDMVAFDATGNVRWIVPNETPQIATTDGGVIGQSGITYDQNGNATGELPNLTYSWTENAYTDGPVDSVVSAGVDVALSFNAFADGSPSQNRTAVNLVRSPMFIPFAISGVNIGNIYFITPDEIEDVENYYSTLVGALNPTQLALYPLSFTRATAARFLGALGTTNTIVGYIDHGLVSNGQVEARALCFWRLCLAAAALTTWTSTGLTDPGILYPPVGAGL